MNTENERLAEAREGTEAWKRWGPYLSERQWGTVREDYSAGGDAWNYFSHDQARSRMYKWGEDGIAGISDDRQFLCWSLGLWNGNDPILKERMFGLTNSEGNHGEDVKEYYFYLDSTPTHSYMKYLYKYPQRTYPYEDLIRTNRERSREQMEYELLDTGIFHEDKYYDVFVEFAKAAADDVLIKISAVNRGPDTVTLHIVPQLWFRNRWWMNTGEEKPSLHADTAPEGMQIIEAEHATLGTYRLYCEGAGEVLFTENETNTERLWGQPNATRYVKDGINNYIVNGQHDAVNPEQTGTKAAAHHALTIGPHETGVVRLRLSGNAPQAAFGADFDATFEARKQEADDYYKGITPEGVNEDQANVMRQALAGMLWSKQYYFFDVDRWLQEHDAHPLFGGKHQSRNSEWFHMVNDDIISMPDKWEYPWYAAWDLAFHTLALSMVDPDFAKDQLLLMLSGTYIHANGQIPAYEWNFGDVNPPVHAWAVLFNYNMQGKDGPFDIPFLKNAFKKLLLNFNWWVNRKDPQGRNVFSGGFLGLDNIGVFDRSAPLPTGGTLEQADGTAWMAFYCQTMLAIAVEIAKVDPSYEDFIVKFTEHFLWIAGSMDRMGDLEDELWDEQDGFFYDVLVMPGGNSQRLKVRSMVGLLPLAVATVFPPAVLERFPEVIERIRAFGVKHPELTANIHDIRIPGVHGRRLLSVVNEDKLRRVLAHMLDENEFLSPFGLRSLDRVHLDQPFTLNVHGEEYRVQYLPAESNTGLFGGNSNWRGPIWLPVNVVLLRALVILYTYYGDDFKVECPTGSGKYMTLYEVSHEITTRLTSIFTRDENGKRPVYGGTAKFQEDPNWRDLILFYEYFHGDNGAGLGASHQTGWTGTVARMIQLFGSMDGEKWLSGNLTGTHYAEEMRFVPEEG